MPIRSDKFNFSNAADYAAHIGFKQVTIDNFTFRLNSLHELNDRVGLGAIPYYQKWALAAPMGFETDVESQEKMPMFGYQFLKLGQYSRESMVGNWAGFMATEGIAVNEWDIQNQAVGCQIATHMYNGNHFIVQHE